MTSCIRWREFITLLQSSDHPILSGDCRSICSATLVAFEAGEIGADRNLVGVRWHEDNVGDRIVRTIRSPAAVQTGGEDGAARPWGLADPIDNTFHFRAIADPWLRGR